MHPDWSGLPIEILQLIAENLVSGFVDLIRFRAVCKSWGLVTVSRPQNPPTQLPWLLLSLEENCCHFFSISDNRTYVLPLPGYESLRDRSFHRTSHGWMFLLENDLNCSLLNPVTGVRISLASMNLQRFLLGMFARPRREEAIDRKPVAKVVLSSDPKVDSNEEIWLMLISRASLLVTKVGDTMWKEVHGRQGTHHIFDDIVYFKEHFYAVDSSGQIVICDLADPHPKMRVVEMEIPESFRGDKIYNVVPSKSYLVKSSGELLLVRRFHGHKVNRTVMFKVFKEDRVGKQWVEVQTLRGHALFLGYNQSISFLASDYFRCKPDCIYFTDNCFRGFDIGKKTEAHDVGIFNLADGRIDLLPGYWCDPRFVTKPPVWLTPSPW